MSLSKFTVNVEAMRARNRAHKAFEIVCADLDKIFVKSLEDARVAYESRCAELRAKQDRAKQELKNIYAQELVEINDYQVKKLQEHLDTP